MRWPEPLPLWTDTGGPLPSPPPPATSSLCQELSGPHPAFPHPFPRPLRRERLLLPHPTPPPPPWREPLCQPSGQPWSPVSMAPLTLSSSAPPAGSGSRTLLGSKLQSEVCLGRAGVLLGTALGGLQPTALTAEGRRQSGRGLEGSVRAPPASPQRVGALGGVVCGQERGGGSAWTGLLHIREQHLSSQCPSLRLRRGAESPRCCSVRAAPTTTSSLLKAGRCFRGESRRRSARRGSRGPRGARLPSPCPSAPEGMEAGGRPSPGHGCSSLSPET